MIFLSTAVDVAVVKELLLFLFKLKNYLSMAGLYFKDRRFLSWRYGAVRPIYKLIVNTFGRCIFSHYRIGAVLIEQR